MGKFILGVVVGVLIIIIGGYGMLRFGAMDLSAKATPGSMERSLANTAMDSYVEHRMPQTGNPVPVNDQNLIEGAHEYEEHCAECHGSHYPRHLIFGDSLSPRAPMLTKRPMHDPDAHIFWVTKNGIRWTGMPSWDGHLSDEETWKIASFLKNTDKLSPAVDAEWKKAADEFGGEEHEGGKPGEKSEAPEHEHTH